MSFPSPTTMYNRQLDAPSFGRNRGNLFMILIIITIPSCISFEIDDRLFHPPRSSFQHLNALSS